VESRIRATADARPLLQQRMVPKLMLVNSLLVLPLNQMLARIEQELSENPALELDELPASESTDWSADEGTSLTTWTPDDEEDDPFGRMAAPVSLQEHLMMTLQAQGLSPRDHAIGERLIGYINDNGYLEAALVQVAQEMNAAEEEVEAVLGRIQRFEPVGVGARKIEECLLLQLRVMEPGEVNRLAQQVVEAHLADLAARRFEKVAQALGATVAEVKAALDALLEYNFPGNARELENVLERAIALSGSAEIQPDDLQLAPPAAVEEPRAPNAKWPLQEYLDRLEREAILEALDKTRFNRTAAAKLLGITFRALRYRMERLGIQ